MRPIEWPEDLARLDSVPMSASGDGRQSWHLDRLDGPSYVHHHSARYVADDLATLMFAMVGGIGASVLPDYMSSPYIRSGKLVEFLPSWGPPSGICHAMFPALVLAVRQPIDFLAENLDGAEILTVLT